MTHSESQLEAELSSEAYDVRRRTWQKRQVMCVTFGVFGFMTSLLAASLEMTWLIRNGLIVFLAAIVGIVLIGVWIAILDVRRGRQTASHASDSQINHTAPNKSPISGDGAACSRDNKVADDATGPTP